MKHELHMDFVLKKQADETEVDVNAYTLDFIEQASIIHMGDFLEELRHEQAIRLIGGVYVLFATAGDARISYNEKNFLDAKKDGIDALVGHARTKERELIESISTDRVFVLNVLSDKKIWDAIIGRQPKIERSLKYFNNPASIDN